MLGEVPLIRLQTLFPLRAIALCRPFFEDQLGTITVTQTLLGTAKLNGLDPAAWLRDTLEKLPTWPNSRIDELLPFAHPVEDGSIQYEKVDD